MKEERRIIYLHACLWTLIVGYIYLLTSPTTPYILAVMQPAPEWPRMLRRRAHASLRRTTLSGAATTVSLPCHRRQNPSSMQYEAFSVEKRNSRV